MRKIVLSAAAIGLMALAACNKPAPTTENAANAMEANLAAQAAALDDEANADTNAAAANAMNSAVATYNGSIASGAGEADPVKNGH